MQTQAFTIAFEEQQDSGDSIPICRGDRTVAYVEPVDLVPDAAELARLFASAPALLAACKALHDAVECYAGSEPDMPSHEASCKAVDDALDLSLTAIALAEKAPGE